MAAAALGIVNNAPGTTCPIPGLLAPFAFNNPMTVVLALALAAVGGSAAGLVGSMIFKKRFSRPADETVETEPAPALSSCTADAALG